MHPPLALAARLVRTPGAVIQVPVLAVFHAGEHVTLGHAIASEFVRDEQPPDFSEPSQQLAEKLLRRLLVLMALYKNTLIDRPPQIMPCAVDPLHQRGAKPTRRPRPGFVSNGLLSRRDLCISASAHRG
jgi:hypothetical protein